MPRYGYRCAQCGVRFDQFRPMAESGATATCPNGHPDAPRDLGGFAPFGNRAERESIEQIQAEHHATAHGHHGHDHTGHSH